MHDDEAQVLRAADSPAHQVTQARHLQTAAIQMSDFVVTTTTRERQTALRRGALANRLAVIPNGIDVQSRTPWGPRVGAARLLFIGHMFYRPNLQAVERICSNILPDLARMGVHVEARIVGLAPQELISRYRRHSAIFTGMVRDLDPFLKDVSMGIAPLESGSGMKQKVLDYMAAALPVLGTTEASVGVASAQRFMTCEDNVEDYGQRIANMLQRPSELKAQGAIARKIAENDHDWSSIAKAAMAQYGEWLLLGKAQIGHAVDPRSSFEPYWLKGLSSRTHAGQPNLTEIKAPGKSYVRIVNGQLQ